MKSEVTIVGAGLAGSLMAIYLAKRGYGVHVYERRPDMRKGSAERGRSINLALTTRGLHALQEVGLADRLLKEFAIPVKGRLIHAVDGTTTFQSYGRHPDEVNYSVSRAELNIALMNAAQSLPGVKFDFEHRCIGLDAETGALEFERRHATSLKLPTEVIIGADGAFSAVRQQLQKLDRFDFHQEYLDWGFKELTIPASASGRFALEAHALHIWPRHDYMMIALPNLDGSFTCTLFLPFEGPHSFGAFNSPAEITEFFQSTFPDALPLMPTLTDDFQRHPVSSLVSIRCAPWHVGSRVVLIGDACHAVVPFYGQGMNASFEDCSVLNACIGTHVPNWAAVFNRFYDLRKRNTDALADLSRQNFVEMRSKVASPLFLLRKRVEKFLNRLFPNTFIPLYNMVTHTLIPYADALERAQRQDQWIARGLIGLLVLTWLALSILGY